MQRILKKNIGLIFCLILAGCVNTLARSQPTIPTLTVVQIVPTQTDLANNSFLVSNGGGEPRSTGYWLTWNICVENNQSEIARTNGGREAGWILIDELLNNPGILIGTIQVETCEQGVNVLKTKNLQSTDMKSDAAYALAAQLLAAQLNLAAGSEYCPASDQVVSQAQLLLVGLDFDGEAGFLGPPKADEKVETARKLSEQLASYNAGTLCTP